jgi:hypothetical protein
MEFPIEKGTKPTKLVTKHHDDDDEIVDNNHQVLVFQNYFQNQRIASSSLLGKQSTSKNHQFQLLQKTLKEPTVL